MQKVTVDQVSVFDLPLYHSRLVDEAIYWAELGRQGTANGLSATEQARLFVVFSLKLRGVVPSEIPDEDVSKTLTSDLVAKLFELLFYGPDGPPAPSLDSEETNPAKKKSTGRKSSGGSKPTIPTTEPLAPKTLVGAKQG